MATGMCRSKSRANCFTFPMSSNTPAFTAMTAMYGGVVHFVAAFAAMVVPMLGNQDFRTAFAALPGLAREARPHVVTAATRAKHGFAHVGTAATRAKHGVVRVAADIRSRVGSRS